MAERLLTPDTRSPIAYAYWLARCQLARVLTCALWGSAWLVALIIPPYLLSLAIDKGLEPKKLGATIAWSLAVMGVGILIAVLGILRHRTMTKIRIDSSMRSVGVIVQHAVTLGGFLADRIATGEVVTIGAADVGQVSEMLTVAGPGIGSVVAYVVASILLLSVSVLLGAIVLVGVPVLVGVVIPLISRLHGRQDAYRTRSGELTSQAGDIVAGLRVLCGLGGKELLLRRYLADSRGVRDSGYRVGAITSWVDALSVGAPAVFLALVIWLAAHMAATGQITTGQVVAVYGWVAVLVTPVAFFIEGVNDLARGVVSARRVVEFLRLAPSGHDGGTALLPPAGASLYDPRTGLELGGNGLVAVAASRLSEALALADRLARRVESDVRWGSAALSDVPLADVRRSILLGDHDAYIFGGTLRTVLGSQDDEQALAAMHAAAGDDIFRGLGHALGATVTARGRNLSGGQRQRIQLARCLVADPAVLILLEPTSAVDAHTESLIVARVAELRSERLTVVVTTSQVWLARADRVAFLDDGRVVAVGTHSGLLSSAPAYKMCVFRDEGEPEPAAEGSSPHRAERDPPV